MQKKLLASLATLLTVSSVMANDNPIEANMTLATDYVWRGYSQTSEAPAIQGGLDWSNDSGLYIGTWGSNVDFGPDDSSSLELDVYAGWATELSNGLGIDLGFIQYLYYDEGGDSDFAELYAGLSHSGFSGTVSYDPDNESSYFDLGYEYELPNEFGLGIHYGVASFDDSAEDYDDYSVTLSKSYAGLDFGLGYYDTDVSNVDEFDSRVVFSVGKSF